MPWSDPLRALALATLVFFLSIAGAYWARGYGLRRGLLDHPGERRSHQVPTPRGGGIGIALGLFCLLLWLALVAAPTYALLAAGLLVTALAGSWDDHRSLPVWPRLAMHLLAGVLLAVSMRLEGSSWPLTVLACVLVPVMINVWNFMDGINGLAASQAALCAMACLIAGVGGDLHMLALAVAAGCVGFLPFNFPKAKVFLGDVGSGSLGYLMALLILLPRMGMQGWPALPPLLPFTAMLVDAGMTLGWRMLRREPWWQPHVQHVYQRAARRVGHARVSAAYAGWTLLAIGIMLGLLPLGEAGGFAGGVAFILLTMALWVRLHRSTGGSEGFSS
jgi:UDP-N-acetylmuramyl pentapeptide phosphotransferase/UDP-N-acetylglucosamine-1-phosphate transferase